VSLTRIAVRNRNPTHNWRAVGVFDDGRLHSGPTGDRSNWSDAKWNDALRPSACGGLACSMVFRKPKAESREPEAESRKPRAGSRKPEAGSRSHRPRIACR
jgi:hypothetical protein